MNFLDQTIKSQEHGKSVKGNKSKFLNTKQNQNSESKTDIPETTLSFGWESA